MGRYELIVIDEKTYSAAITNHSLSMGQKLGLLSGSNLTDVLHIDSPMKIIYLALIGVKNGFNKTYDEFIETFRGKEIYKKDINEIYTRLISSATELHPNKFADSFIQSTSKVIEKNQKRIRPPKFQFECVEDRYVWYCMIHEIESDIFWYHPIPDVERILISKQAYEGWKSNPK